jgi:hypothetical protein
MNAAENADTVEELINNIASEYSWEEVSIAFDQDSVTEINGEYSITFVCILKGVLPSEFGDISTSTLPLTEDGDYEVNPVFKSTTKHEDAVLTDAPKYGVTEFEENSRVADLDQVKKTCAETTLSEKTFVEFIEQGEGLDQIVEFVEVSCFDSEETQAAKTLGAAIAGSSEVPLPEHEGLYFRIHLRGKGFHQEDGFDVTRRFNHVGSVTLNGVEYPTTIDVVSTLNESGGSGQLVHTSDFIVEQDPPTPKIKISEEIKRIDWDDLLASKSPWPESPPFAGCHR